MTNKTKVCTWSIMPLILAGCGSDSSSTPPTAVSASQHAYFLTDQVLPFGKKSAISLTSLHEIDAKKAFVALQHSSSPQCDPEPELEGHHLTVTPSMSQTEKVQFCAYDYRELNAKTASSVIAFAINHDGKTMPSMPHIEAVGVVGEPIAISIEGLGTLNPEIVVVGAPESLFTVDTERKVITYHATEAGVVRLMYSVTEGGDDHLGTIDFTVSRLPNSAPVARHGKVLIQQDERASIDLTKFENYGNNYVESLVFDTDSNGEAIGHELLSLVSVTPPLGMRVERDGEHPTRFTVMSEYAGIYPVHYQITDGEGGYASAMIEVVVEGDTGLLVSDAVFSLAPSEEPREFRFNVLDFVQTSTGVSRVSLVSDSLEVSHIAHPSTPAFITEVDQEGTWLTWRYPGSLMQGLTHIRYKVTDALTGLVTHAQAHIDVGRNLPKFRRLNVTGATSGSSPVTGDVLQVTPVCETSVACNENLTRWEWRQSGDIVLSGVGPEFSRYQVQEFSCDDTLEVRVTPVAAFGEGKEPLVGIAARTTWDPSTAPELNLSQTQAKEGEVVTLQVRACANAEAHVSITKGFDRQNRPDIGTTMLAKVVNDGDYLGSYTFETDGNGEASIQLSAPKGGAKSLIEVTSRGAKADAELVISTITSPDHPNANLWGHMPDVLKTTDPKTGAPLLMVRPLLEVELNELTWKPMSGAKPIDVEGETYSQLDWWDAETLCQTALPVSMYGSRLISPRLPNVAEVQAFSPLVSDPANNGVMQQFGWPDLTGNWTSEVRFDWKDEFFLWHSNGRREADIPTDWHWIGYAERRDFHGVSCVADGE